MVSVALVACKDVKQGVLQPQGPLAGLRYVNLVNDTGAVDFRIVNFIGDAPVAGAAAFRTGGSPNGLPTNFLPPHAPVEAGRDVEVRVFMNGLDPVVASQVVFDTTLNLSASVNYTFYLYGSARTVNGVHALVTTDTIPAPAAGKIAVRFLNLAPSLAGSGLPDVTVRPDAWISGPTVVPPFAGTASAANLAFAAFTGYASYDTSSSYRVSLTATGVPATVFSASPLVRGVLGTGTANPVAGANVPGTAITAVIVPISVAGSAAPQGGAPTSRTPLALTFGAATVTVQTGVTSILTNRSPTAADSTTATSGFTHGLVVGDVITVAAANEPEYNGWQIVSAKADSLSCNPTNAGDSSTKCAASNVIATTFSRFRYRISGTPANSPATGTVTYRAYAASAQNPASTNYSIPWVIYLIDSKPALTAP